MAKPALHFVLAFCLFTSAAAVPAFPQGADQPGRTREPAKPEDEVREQMEKDMAKRQNKLRQEKLKKDTDQLVELATELKKYVDKSNENLLSLEVVKKAEEIEKLARSVKEKMKGE